MTKKYTQLSLEQRYQIAALRQTGCSISEIGMIVGYDKSTISRELKRNMPHAGQGAGVYDARKAEAKTRFRHVKKPKSVRFSLSMKLKIKRWMEEDKLSPELISVKGKQELGEFVSHEIIYRWIWNSKFSDRRENKQFKYLYKELKHGKRRSKRGSYKRKRGQIPNRIGIDQRPKVVMQRKRLGDLETDLMLGKNHQAGLLVIVDRASLKTKLTKISSKEAHYIATRMNRKLSRDKSWIKTITFDNDSAFHHHERVSKSIGCNNYFTRPYTSQDKGTVENRIGVLRMFFPKKTDFSKISAKEIKRVERKINQRPIRKFHYKTANQVFNEKKCA